MTVPPVRPRQDRETPRKQLAHRLKTALFRRPGLDAWLERRAALRRFVYPRLLPERASRWSALQQAADTPVADELIMILTLVPPEDGGGGSRPAQLAAELRRRGLAIDWRYVLPIFPWPRRHRPDVAGVSVRWLGDAGDASPVGPHRVRMVLLEAPHPRLCAEARALTGAQPLVYDAIDLWDGELGRGWYSADAESWALGHAHRLVASARSIADDLAARSGREVRLLPNAVDRRLFDPVIARPRPTDLRPGAPTVIYVGALWGEWLDLELVARLAEALPEATINLVGPSGGRALPRARNVFALGLKAQVEIPAYLQAADVAIIPFRPSRLTDAVSPLKGFEYLAMHKPVVSTALPELVGAPGVTMASDPDAFVTAVRRAAAERPDLGGIEEFVARQTWQARVDELLALSDV